MRFVSVKFETFVADFYKTKSQGAIERGIPWELSIVSLRNLLRATICPYTGIQLTVPVLGVPKSSDLTIDRIDNTKGYVPGNVQAISRAANNFKSIFENPKYPLDMETAAVALTRISKHVTKVKNASGVQK